MYLTDKKSNIIRERQDHEELEVLLESFAKQAEEIVNEAENIEARFLVLCARVLLIFPAEQCTIDARNCGTNIRL